MRNKVILTDCGKTFQEVIALITASMNQVPDVPLMDSKVSLFRVADFMGQAIAAVSKFETLISLANEVDKSLLELFMSSMHTGEIIDLQRELHALLAQVVKPFIQALKLALNQATAIIKKETEC